MDSIRKTVGSFFSPMKNMVAVEPADDGRGLVRTSELISNFKKQVVAEEQWELSSVTQSDGATAQPAERQKGIVVALEDGQTRYLVRRIPNEQKVGVVDVVVTHASHMDPNWVRVEEKQVKNAKLEDYLDQGEDEIRETEGNLGKTDDGKKESTDTSQPLAQSEDKGDSIGHYPDQGEGKKKSSDKDQNNAEDTTSKM